MRDSRGFGCATIVSPEDQIVNFDGLRRETMEAGVLERDAFTCFHCNSIEHTPAHPGPNDIGFCRHCMRRICTRCSDLPCMPFEKRLEALERGIKEALNREWALSDAAR